MLLGSHIRELAYVDVTLSIFVPAGEKWVKMPKGVIRAIVQRVWYVRP
jgi:hypothetical protein